MSSFELKRLAAVALSKALEEKKICHAYIGGFAVNLLGSRRLTDDIDVELDVPKDVLRQRVIEATSNDARFRLHGLKLVFQPDDSSLPAIPIETLPAGELGLPQSFSIMPIGEESLPVLQPEILILTKIKRCVHAIGSTRPKTVRKLHSDLHDIEHVLDWLATHDKKIDFAEYHAAEPERLYSAVRQLLAYFASESRASLLDLMKKVLSEEDLQRVGG